MLQLIENHKTLPLHSFVVPCGFPSPADDHLEDHIDLVAHLVSRPSSTFVMQVSGDSMEGAGIFTGDYVVIDKSVETKPGHIVVAVLNGEMTLKKFEKRAGQYLLTSTNPRKYKPIELNEDNPPEIWGVVVGVVRKCV